MPDLNWRTTLRRRVVVQLYLDDRADLGAAMNMARIVAIAPIADGGMGVRIVTHTYQDCALLVSETQSWTDSPLPGALDLAFEAALPGGEWPVFSFELASGHGPRTTSVAS